MNEDGYSLSDFAGLLRRRGKSIFLVTLAVAMLSIVVTYSIEDLYRSTGTIVIEGPEVSQSFLPGTYQSPDHEQRIARINDGVMTRDNLLRIVEKHNLYLDDRKNGSASSVVGMLRRNVELDLLLSEDDPRTRDEGDVIGFKVSFYHPNPDVAKAVARDIVELYQAVNKERRQAAYVETAAALTREAENLSAQVSRYESALAEFKTQNPGALPEDRKYNRSVIERKARDLDSLDREIRSLQERKTILQSQLAQTPPWLAAVGPDGQAVGATSDRLRTLEAEYLRLIGIYSESHPDVQRVKREIAALSGGDAGVALRQAAEAQLAAKRIELADAQTQYGPDHPDVVNLSRTVAKLQEQVDSLPDRGDGPPPNNPTYVNLELQLRGVNTELSALRADKQQLESQTIELDRQAQVAPEVERQYLELTRDLDLARQQYRDIKARQMAVERAGVLEEEELSERYVVTQQPGLAYEPAFPNRPLFIAIGLFLAVTIGLAFGMSAEAFDGTIRTTRDVRMILEMPPIAAIPVIRTAEESRKVRMANLTYAFGSAAAVIAVAIYVYLQSSAMT